MGRPLKFDLTGMRFGSLTVVEHVGSGYWACECDCGSKLTVSGGNLRSGNTKSCGCKRLEHEDISGQRFNRLTAVEYVGNGRWLCKCDCGNETTVKAHDLKTGNTKSCGCLFKEVAGTATFEDKTGKRYGRLVAVSYVGRGKWLCQCDCGNTTVVDGSELNKGSTTSCGCYRREHSSIANRKHGKHGSRLYRVWSSMRQRCNNPKQYNYQNYGGRGITICEEWDNFDTFYQWAMDNGYDPDAAFSECTIDRIDNDGPYSPDNCRWVSAAVQATNKRTKHVDRIDDNGNVIESFKSAAEAAEKYGCHASSVSAVCRGRDKSVYGMRFRYADEVELCES